MMMRIKSIDDENPLFLEINVDKYGDGHYVTFTKKKESDARDILSNFGAYLLHTYDDKKIMTLCTRAHA